MITATTEKKASQHSPPSEHQLPFAANVLAAEAWLQNLPTQGFGDACRSLFNALRALNRTNIAAHQRLQLLEALRPQVLDYCRRFEAYFVDQTFPLEDKTAKVVRLAVQFQAELAMGYQRVVEDPACADTFGKAQKATAAHRALTAHGLYLLRSAQSYEALPATVWNKIYGVYRRAENLGVANEHVADLDCGLASSATASECLRKIALFQLAQPTRLPQREIGELYAWFDENSHLIGLHRERAFNLQEAHFYLNLAEAAMPQPIGALASPNTDTRYLFLEPMLLELLGSSSACSTFGLSVARRLTPGKDGWQDSGENRTVLFATGAEGCAALLRADIAAVQRRLNAPELKHLELSPQQRDERTGLSARVAQRLNPGQTALQQVSRDEIWGGSDPETIAASHSKPGLVRFYDNKARAVLIADRQNLRMSQLVAVTAERMTPVIGVVRAITPTADSTRVWADVEIFTGTAVAAHAYIEGEKRRRLPCLVVTGEHGAGAIESVMLLPAIFPNGTWITLERNGKWSNQRLARLIETTDDFSQYLLVSAE